MHSLTYRRLLLGSAIATFILIISGSIVRISASNAGCPDWPLCYGQLLPPARLDTWIEFIHRLLAMIVGLLILGSGIVAWKRQDSDVWTRRPPLVAVVLFLLQVMLGAFVVQFNSPELTRMTHMGLAMLILACLIMPIVALTIIDENTTETSQNNSRTRWGARSLKHMRRYRRLVTAATVTVWFLTFTGAGVAEYHLSGREQTFLLGGFSGMLTVSHHGTMLTALLLCSAVVWSTWQKRRQDRIILTTGMIVGGLFLLRVGASVVPPTIFPTLPSILNGLHLGIWSIMVVLSMLALRRPAPVMLELSMNAIAGRSSVPLQQPSLLADYISLTKPKVIMLLLATTLSAMYITDKGAPSLILVFWTMLGGYLAAGGAGAINCAFDHDIDIYMGRTSKRPVPNGRISRHNAFWFGMVLCATSFIILAVFTTMLAAILALLGVIYYALFYTRWLKRSTWQNIVIGGGAGSIPPLVGWTAVTGSLTLPAIMLFVIIFYWTPPHFWALAIVKQKDYARAGVPMLPVVAGEKETYRQILLYSILMVAMTLLMTPLQAMGSLYLLLAIVLGSIFIRYAWNIWREGSQAHIWGLYKYSLLYLALLFGAMVLDRMILL